MQTHWIPETNLDRLDAKLEQLVKRAEKLGVPAPSARVLTGAYTTWHVPRWWAEQQATQAFTIGGCPPEALVPRHWYEVEMLGEAPRLPGGWQLLAKVERDEGATRNLVSTVPNAPDGVVARYLDVDPQHCVHCRTDRRRKATFVLVDEVGCEVQVGRQCLRDFLGHLSPERVADMLSFVTSLDGLLGEAADEDWGWEPRGYHPEPVEDTLTVLAITSAIIELDGWRPRSGAFPYTSDMVVDVLRPSRRPDKNELLRLNQIRDAYPAHRQRAEKAISWIRDLKPDNDYLFNLQTSLSGDEVPLKRLGLACSGMPAWDRAMEREVRYAREREQVADSEHQGKVGDRLRDLTLTVTHFRAIEGNYGTTLLFKFIDPDGNAFAWFCSGSAPRVPGDGEFGTRPVEVGDTVTLTGTVKRHTEFNGSRETQLSRCKVA